MATADVLSYTPAALRTPAHVAAALCFALATHATPAAASPLRLRLALEPGVTTYDSADPRYVLPAPNQEVALRNREGSRAWGVLGGASIALGVTDRLLLQIHGDRKDFVRGEENVRLSTLGGSALYCIDVLWLTPFLEVGVANVWLEMDVGSVQLSDGTVLEDVGTIDASSLSPFLGVGADLRITDWLFGGVVFRYFAALANDDGRTVQPAFTTMNGRLGVQLGGP